VDRPRLPTLLICRQALGVFAFSLLWYLAQILPLPAAQHRRIRSAATAFLWRGRLEKLASDELHIPPAEGGLGMTCVRSRAHALLAKQACHCLTAGGRPAAHIAYWLGLRLRQHLPALAAGPHAEFVPPAFADLGHLLVETFGVEGVTTADLAAVSAKQLYAAFTTTFPRPKIETKLPHLNWPSIWCLLHLPGLPPAHCYVGGSRL
jgi:hypothetical protein